MDPILSPNSGELRVRELPPSEAPPSSAILVRREGDQSSLRAVQGRKSRGRYSVLINRGFLWRTDVCLLINGLGNWDTRRKRGGVSWWGEQHHQRGRACASTRSRSPRYTERCLLRSTTQNGAFSDLPLGLMRLPYRTCLLYTSPSPRDKRQSRMPSSA